MKRTTIAIGLAGAVLLGPAAAAEASTGHHAGQQVQPSCGCTHHHGHHPGKHHGKKHGHPRPKPRPKPHHHRKPCPPVHHRHHPKPVVHPRPPILTPPATTVVHHGPEARVRIVSPSDLPAQLAFTGMSEGLVLVGLGGAALVFLGAGVYRLAGGFKQDRAKHRSI